MSNDETRTEPATLAPVDNERQAEADRRDEQRQDEADRRRDDDTNDTDEAAAADAEAIEGEGDYVLSLADGSRVRSTSPGITEHNGQAVTRTAHMPAETD